MKSLILFLLLSLFCVTNSFAAIDWTYSNFAYTNMGSNVISDAETEDDTFTVAGGTGARFPASGMFFVTVYDYDCDNARTCATKEVIKIKSRSTDTFTIKARNQEGTTHTGDWAENDKIELAITGGAVNSIITEIDTKLTGDSTLMEVSDEPIENIEADPSVVRTSVRPVVQAQGVSEDESAAVYIKIDPTDTQQQIGIYGEITSEQADTEAAFMKIVHEGAGDAVYVPMWTNAGVAFEAASFGNGTKGIISTIQTSDCANTVLFNALWEQDTIPNYGLMYFDHVPANSILIRKTSTADAGYSQFRLMDHDLSKSVFNIYNNGKTVLSSIDATAGATIKDSPDFTLAGSYWDGAQAVTRNFIQRHVVTATTPASEIRWLVGNSGFESIIAILSATGLDLQANGLSGLGSITCKAGGCNIDGQGGDIIGVDDADFDGTLEGLRMVVDKVGTGDIATTEVRQNVLVNTSASGDIVLTLPAAAAGMEVYVVITVAHDVDINPQNDDKILVLTSTAGDAISSDATIGSYVHLIAVDGVNWMPLDRQGTWTDVD